MPTPTDTQKVVFLWYDGKKHTVSVSAGSETVDFEEMKKTYRETIDLKQDLCKDVYYLGAALLGHPTAAKGFMVGWIVRGLKDAIEEKGHKWKVDHSSESVTNDEVKTLMVGTLRDLADKIEKDDSYHLEKKPILRGEGDDATDIFK